MPSPPTGPFVASGGPGRAPARALLLRLLPPLLCIAMGGALIAAVRPGMAQAYHDQGSAERRSLLLPAEYTQLMSLGHRDALADYLFGMALVDYGLSFQEKQAYSGAYRALDTITSLAPTFDRPYLYADTLLTLQAKPPPIENYHQAREIHRRGMKAMPFHAELWLVAGQYAAYLAAPRLPADQRREMRVEGARILARACELASGNENIPYNCLAAAKILNESGRKEAVIRMLERTLAVQDDPDIRRRALGALLLVQGEQVREQQRRRLEAIEQEWRSNAGSVSRAMVSLLGPMPDVWSCAGAAAFLRPGCQASWRFWGEERQALAAP